MGLGDHEPVTSPSLLIRIKDASDTESWLMFADVYGPVIKGYCRRRGFQSSDIDDIAQEVLTAVARAIERFEYNPQKGKFRSWLATVTANKLKSFVTRNGRRDEQLAEFVDQLAAAPDSDTEWNTVFLSEVFESACDRVRPQFEPQTWQCFYATWVERKSAADVAKEMGIQVHAVYVNKSRVLKKLEAEFLSLSDDFPLAEK